ncbi:hypothetical protein EXIGLDRAFT_698895 [Exidia glandulosa HHB12029]|uniref:Uncharacterized protein n=1 Tax=Exidia glandulosa HHB12029 TaxID=1314781 RepID=A0A165E244_EXIGL|nr:hypothetical protein EXIGLDRAFT_698895 [Exidia glandulosa HHB12029]
MSTEAILPHDTRWAGPKRFIPRGQSLTTVGTGVTLFGAHFGTWALITLDPAAPSEPEGDGAAGAVSTPVKSLANCDFALSSLGSLDNRNHTLIVTLEEQGQLFIYNATVTTGSASESATIPLSMSSSPASTSTTTTTTTSLLTSLPTTPLSGPSTPRVTMNMPNTPLSQSITAGQRLAIFITLPIICIVALIVGFAVVSLRRSRQKRRPAIRPYAVFAPGTDPAFRSGVYDWKLSFLTEKELPPLPQGELGPTRTAHQDTVPLSDLERAVEQAGFSVTALVTSLRLVQGRACEADIDEDHPPVYVHPAET